MNRFFDFTNRQLKFVGFLSALLIIQAGYLFVRNNVIPTNPPESFEVFIGENEKIYTGIFVLDPNTAPADSLELLPGVGKVIADRIIAYRLEKPFEQAIDITEVKGIGPKVYEKIKPYLKVSHFERR